VAASRAVRIAQDSGDPALGEATLSQANVLTKEGQYAQALAAYDRALQLVETGHGAAHEAMHILRSEVEALVATGHAARAVDVARRACAMARALGPWRQAQAELALARALIATGKDRQPAVAVAESARALIVGTGYRKTLDEIDAWLAQALQV